MLSVYVLLSSRSRSGSADINRLGKYTVVGNVLGHHEGLKSTHRESVQKGNTYTFNNTCIKIDDMHGTSLTLGLQLIDLLTQIKIY
jgi:hypothetical protein